MNKLVSTSERGKSRKYVLLSKAELDQAQCLSIRIFFLTIIDAGTSFLVPLVNYYLVKLFEKFVM